MTITTTITITITTAHHGHHSRDN